MKWYSRLTTKYLFDQMIECMKINNHNALFFSFIINSSSTATAEMRSTAPFLFTNNKKKNGKQTTTEKIAYISALEYVVSVNWRQINKTVTNKLQFSFGISISIRLSHTIWFGVVRMVQRILRVRREVLKKATTYNKVWKWQKKERQWHYGEVRSNHATTIIFQPACRSIPNKYRLRIFMRLLLSSVNLHMQWKWQCWKKGMIIQYAIRLRYWSIKPRFIESNSITTS